MLTAGRGAGGWRLAILTACLSAATVTAVCGQTGSPRKRKPAQGPARAPVTFESARAFEHVRQLVAIGPRPAGSPGIEAARRYIGAQISSYGLSVVEQRFEGQTPFGPVKMANLVVTIPGGTSDRLLIAGHYDTKLFRQFRFVGANDGGSSAAMLLELARVLKHRPNPLTIELVFFDGEEALVDWTGTDHTYGSRHYVEAARAAGTIRTVGAMILLDMIGDRDLTIRRESASTRWLTDLVWAAAERLGHRDVFLDEELVVDDDHVPFLTAGIPAVDIIDLDYAAWHTADDTLDKVSARSLQTVGDVVLEALGKIEARLRRE